mgnify:CR=1 FL=1
MGTLFNESDILINTNNYMLSLLNYLVNGWNTKGERYNLTGECKGVWTFEDTLTGAVLQTHIICDDY